MFNKVSVLLMSAISPSTIILFINADQDIKLNLDSIYDQVDDYYIEIIQDNVLTYKRKEKKQKLLQRDKIGFLRIIDALECNMWPGMKRKKIKKT